MGWGMEGQRPRRPFPAPILAPAGNPKGLCYVAGDPIITVPADRLRYPDGRGYNLDEHHFLQYYRGGLHTLRQYYASHQPANLFEYFGIETPETLAVDGYDPPWFDESQINSPGDEKGLSREHGNQGFGPVSEEKLRLEAARLDRVLMSIRDRGFRPEMGGYIRGYFMLRPNGEWVFTIREGLHRTAALVQLGAREIDVRFHQAYPRFVEEADARAWPMVKNARVSEEAALGMFSQFFRPSEKRPPRTSTGPDAAGRPPLEKL
ncbi:MAG: hypothetical protein EA353_09900 [Puniceicoccaceae bacterium]|nr:MAG: hypothetical protein EA353_09900 [Puniceicoccaceae bacterium]